MTDSGFQKVNQSEEALYGPRKLLLCGFAAEVQPKFNKLLEIIGLSGLPLVWVTEDQAAMPVGELVQLADGAGPGAVHTYPVAEQVVAFGVAIGELNADAVAGDEVPLFLGAAMQHQFGAVLLQDLLKPLGSNQTLVPACCAFNRRVVDANNPAQILCALQNFRQSRCLVITKVSRCKEAKCCFG